METMIIKQCAFNGDVCNLIYRNEQGTIFYDDCEQVAISRCPYKLFSKGLITKEQLNEKVKELRND